MGVDALGQKAVPILQTWHRDEMHEPVVVLS